jgi:hypothetical protein
MNIKRIISFEHNFNGHEKFKLITYLTSKKGFMGLSTSDIKKRILYVFDSKNDKKGDAKMYFLNDEREVDKQLTNTEYNEVADFVVQFQTFQEANKSKEKESKEVAD